MLKWGPTLVRLGAELGTEMGQFWVLERGFKSLWLGSEMGSEMHGFRS